MNMTEEALNLFRTKMEELNCLIRAGNTPVKRELYGNHSLKMILNFAAMHDVKLLLREPEDIAAGNNLWYVNLKTWRDYTKILVFHWVNKSEEKNNWQERVSDLKYAGLTYNVFGYWLTKGNAPMFNSFCLLAALEGFELKWKAVNQ